MVARVYRHLDYSASNRRIFQAEAGIRDWSVTGVQTCALPIFLKLAEQPLHERVTGREEVEVLFPHRFVAVERAEPARASGHAWQVLDERVRAEFDVPRPLPRAFDRLEPVEVRSVEDETLHALVEVVANARENLRRLLRRVAIVVKVVVDSLLPCVGRATHLGRECLDRQRLPDLRGSLGLSDRGLHVRQRALEAAERCREEADALVQVDDLALETVRGTEVDDLDRRRPVDTIEAADPLLHRGRIPRQVEENEAPAELEVAALAAGLRRDEKGRAVGPPELRHLDVTAFRSELLVEDS